MIAVREKSGWVLLLVCLLIAGVGSLGVAQENGKDTDKAKSEEKKEKKKKKDLPLEPTRKIEFTTDEATWLSLDVSPDGQTIVFELLGDLYTLPIAGGDATRITEGMAFDSQPRFSPNGKHIAFLSDRSGSENIWIVKPDGKDPKQISKDKSKTSFASPLWSSDGDYVIASRTSWGLRTYELWMYHLKGGKGVQITKAKSSGNTPNNQRHNALGAVMSPDGRYLYYARKRGGFQYNAIFPLWQIARRDMRTGDEDIITQALGSAIRPLLSPDGKHLVYGTRHETQTGLRIRNLQTGEDRWLIYPIQRDDQEAIFSRDLLPGYAFMPDGKEILVTSGGKILRVSVSTGTAQVIPFSAQVSLDLGPQLNFPRRVEDGPVRARLIQDATQSPDGKRIAFSTLTHLYTMDLGSGNPKRLTKGNNREFQPAWSPDGKWIAYVTWETDGGYLWKIRSNGSGQPQKINGVAAYYSDPAFSPDGTKIIARRGSGYMRTQTGGGSLDLVWYPADGGDASLIVPARGLGKPHFGPEKDRIYLYASTPIGFGQGQGLVSIRYDGTDRQTHIRVTGEGLYAAEKPVGANDMRIRPDGRWALVKVQNQLYLVAVPLVGGDTPTINVSGPSLPLKKLTDVGADTFAWADGGKTITWAIGSTFFRQPFDSISFEEPKKDEKEDANGKENGEEKDSDEGKEEKKEFKPKEADESVERFDVTLEFPRAKPEGTIVLRRATVITMNGDEVIRNADIVVTGNRITAVGRRGSVQIPRGARQFDVRGKYIVPGFIDTHAHWRVQRNVLNTQNWSFLANLAYGVTAGLDVQTSTNDTFAYQDMVDTGMIPGLRAYATGPGIFSDNAFKTMDEVKGVMQRYKEHYRTRNLKSYIVGNRKQRQLVVQAAKELEMMPTTEGGLDLKLDLTHVIDGFAGNEHTLPIVPLYKDVVELVAQSGIGYTPTLLVLYGGPWAENYYYQTTEVHDDPKLNRFTPHKVLDSVTQRRRQWFREEEHSFSKAAAQAAKIIRAGGLVGIGSHGQLQGLGYHWEMWSLASGGLTGMETLRAATLHGAKIIGLAQDLGSIEVSKLADMVILDRNPLDDIHNTNTVRYVMKNGELYEGDTLKQIWPVEKELPPLWWWNDKPKEHGSGQ